MPVLHAFGEEVERPSLARELRAGRERPDRLRSPLLAAALTPTATPIFVGPARLYSLVATCETSQAPVHGRAGRR